MHSETIVRVRRWFTWPKIRWGLLGAGLFGLFWFFRSSTYRGDGDLIARLIEGHIWYYEREVLLHFLLVLGHWILSPWHWNGMQVLNLFSCLSGVFFFCLLVRFSRDWLGNPLPPFLLYLASGFTILFAGHTEYYGPVLAAALLFFERTYRFVRGDIPLRQALWVYALFVSFHLVALFAFPGVLYLVWRARNAKDFRRQLVVGLLPVVALVLFIWWNPFYPRTENLLISRRLCPLTGPVADWKTAFLSWKHLKGWAYWQLKACVPGLPMMAIFLSPNVRRKAAWGSFHTFLALCSVGFLVFSVIWHPDLGIVRDWDLFALSVFPYTVLGLSAWNASSGLVRKAIWVFLLASAAWTWTHIVHDAKLGHRGRGSIVVRGVRKETVQVNVDGHKFGPVIHNVLEGKRRVRVISLEDRDAWRGLVKVESGETTIIDYRPGMPDDPEFEEAFRDAFPPGDKPSSLAPGEQIERKGR